MCNYADAFMFRSTLYYITPPHCTAPHCAALRLLHHIHCTELHCTRTTQVPKMVTYDEFWIRYFYRVHEKEAERDRRAALLAKQVKTH